MSPRARLLLRIVEVAGRALRQELEGPPESAASNVKRVIRLLCELAEVEGEA